MNINSIINSIICSGVNHANSESEKNVLLKESNLLLFQKKYKEAIESYKIVLNYEHDNPIIYSNLALAYIKIKSFKEAEFCATKSIFYDKDNIKSYYRRSLARSGLERYSDALDDLNKILEIEKYNSEAINESARIQTLLENQILFNLKNSNNQKENVQDEQLKLKYLNQFDQFLLEVDHDVQEKNKILNFYKLNDWFNLNQLNQIKQYQKEEEQEQPKQKQPKQEQEQYKEISNNENNNIEIESNNENKRELDQNNSKLERLFWKVFSNKFLRTEILGKVNSIVYEFSRFSDYTYGYRKKFSTIVSVSWMCKKQLFELLKCKLKQNEKLDFGNKEEIEKWIVSIYDKEILRMVLKKIITPSYGVNQLFEISVSKLNYPILDILFDDYNIQLLTSDWQSLFKYSNVQMLDYCLKKIETRYYKQHQQIKKLEILDKEFKSDLIPFLISDCDGPCTEFLIYCFQYPNYFIDYEASIEVEYCKFEKIESEEIKEKIYNMKNIDLYDIVYSFPVSNNNNYDVDDEEEGLLLVRQISNHIKILNRFLLNQTNPIYNEKIDEANNHKGIKSRYKIKNLMILLLELSKLLCGIKMYRPYIDGLCEYLVGYYNRFNDFIWDEELFSNFEFEESDLFVHHNVGIFSKIIELKNQNEDPSSRLINTSCFTSDKIIKSKNSIEFYKTVLLKKNIKLFSKILTNKHQLYNSIYQNSTMEAFKEIVTSSEVIENFVNLKDSFIYEKEKFLTDIIQSRKPLYFSKNIKEYNHQVKIVDKLTIDLLFKYSHYYLNTNKYHLFRFSSMDLISYFWEKHNHMVTSINKSSNSNSASSDGSVPKQQLLNPVPFYLIYFGVDLSDASFQELLYSDSFAVSKMWEITPSLPIPQSNGTESIQEQEKSMLETICGYLYISNYKFLSESEYYSFLKCIPTSVLSTTKFNFNKFANQTMTHFLENFSKMDIPRLRLMLDQIQVETKEWKKQIEDSKYSFNRDYNMDSLKFENVSSAEPIQLIYYLLSTKHKMLLSSYEPIITLAFKVILQSSDITIYRLSEIQYLLDRYSMTPLENEFILTFFHLHVKSIRLSKFILMKMKHLNVLPTFYQFLELFNMLNSPYPSQRPKEVNHFLKLLCTYINSETFPLKKIINSSVQQLFFALRDRLTVKYITDFNISPKDQEPIYNLDMEYLVDVYDVDSIKILLRKSRSMETLNKNLQSKIKSMIDPDFLKNLKDEKYDNSNNLDAVKNFDFEKLNSKKKIVIKTTNNKGDQKVLNINFNFK